MAIRAPHKRTAILRGHSALAALWLLHAVSLCQHVSGVTHLELPDFHGERARQRHAAGDARRSRN